MICSATCQQQVACRAITIQPSSNCLKPAADKSLQGRLMEAIEEYHKALALRPEDAFAAEMLGVALREVVPYPDDMGIALGP